MYQNVLHETCEVGAAVQEVQESQELFGSVRLIGACRGDKQLSTITFGSETDSD